MKLVEHQWEAEYAEPHCFACREVIRQRDADGYMNMTVGRVRVWWHLPCALPELVREFEQALEEHLAEEDE